MMERTSARRLTRRFVAIALLAIAVGCQTSKPPPPPQPPPKIETRVNHFIGTPLSGPRRATTVPTITPEEAMSVDVIFASYGASVISPSNPPGAVPLSSKSRLIVVSRDDSPVVPTSGLTSNAYYLAMNDVEEIKKQIASTVVPTLFSAAIVGGSMSTLQGALPAGTTALFEALDSGESALSAIPGQPRRRRVAVEVSRPSASDTNNPAQVQVALIVEDYVYPHVDQFASKMDEGAPPTTAPSTPANTADDSITLQREIVLLDPIPIVADKPIAFSLFVPFRFTGSKANYAYVMVLIGAGSSDNADHVKATAQCVADLKRSSDLAAQRPFVAPLESPDWAVLRGPVESLYWPGRRRAALTFLAHQTGAKICEDVVLVADEPTLATLSETVIQKTAASTEFHQNKTLGWLLDATSLKLMSDALSASKINPELAAVLTQNAGEAGRHPGSLEEITKVMTSREDLENRLIAENLIFLEDNAPGSRVRAYDWLRARDRAPAGFDPLAGPKERRDALEKALNSPTPTPSTRPAAPTNATAQSP